MRCVIAANGPDENASVERFGRCAYFLVVENGKIVESIKNKAISLPRGAGITSAQEVLKYSPKRVVCLSMGRHPQEILSSYGVEVKFFSGSVKQCLENFLGSC